MVVESENGYRLYSKIVTLRPRHTRKIFFFAKRKDGWKLEDKIPVDMEICISKFTGLPMLKKKSCSSRSSLSIGGVIKTNGKRGTQPSSFSIHASQVTPIEERNLILPLKHQKG